MIYKNYLVAALLVCSGAVFSQVGKTRKLGAAGQIAKTIRNTSVSKEHKSGSSVYPLATPSGAVISATVNRKTIVDGTTRIVGPAGKNGSFQLSVDGSGTVNGLYTSIVDRKAYRYSTDAATGQVIAKEVAIESVLCMDYTAVPDARPEAPAGTAQRTAAIPKFQSKPDSKYVIYIDLDGEVSTSNWNNGNTVYAQARNWTDADVKVIWQTAAQDYFTYDVNVTTDRSVYDATPLHSRVSAALLILIRSTTAPAILAGYSTMAQKQPVKPLHTK